MEDIPYAAVVDDANLSTTCSNCFMKGGKLLCCSACKFVYYCSKVGVLEIATIIYLGNSVYFDADCSRLANCIGLST